MAVRGRRRDKCRARRFDSVSASVRTQGAAIWNRRPDNGGFKPPLVRCGAAQPSGVGDLGHTSPLDG